jgi:lipid-binding SYLF domain-containing protein
MSSKPLNASRRTALLVLVAATVAACATTDSGKPMSSADQDKLVSDAQVTLSNFVRDPDQTWIQDNLNRAKAILIAPQIVKAGFILGGSGGRAVLVVREAGPHPAIAVPWTGPAFYNLATASVGFQAGVEVSEVVIVVMTDKGLNSLLSTSFKIGGDASIAAGPWVQAPSLRSRGSHLVLAREGVYGGLNLDGTVVHTNSGWNDAYYGGKTCCRRTS